MRSYILIPPFFHSIVFRKDIYIKYMIKTLNKSGCEVSKNFFKCKSCINVNPNIGKKKWSSKKKRRMK